MPSTEIVHRTCPLCEAHCGIDVEVDRARNEVVMIRGDEQDPLSRGYICPKAYGLKGLHEDPDRLRRPLVREGDDWREVSWEEAFDRAASGIAAIRERYGTNALATYLGNPNAHDLGSALYGAPFQRALGTRWRFSATSVDQLPMMVANSQILGGPGMFPISDIDRTDFLLMLGANPLASNGSIMTAPDFPGRLRTLRERGGTLVVVDPRRTRTAEMAQRHLFIRPGSDAYLLFALVHVLFEEDLVSLGRLEAITRGIDELRTLAKEFAPERVAPVTGIAAEDVRRLARDFAAAERAACYGRIGTCTQEFGTLASWLVIALNTLTGNLDRAGGALFPRGAATPRDDTPRKRGTYPIGRWRSRVRGLPEFAGELPAATLAEEIDTPGPDGECVRGLVTVAGNPVLSTPNGERLAGALGSLDFMVSVDIYLNETTRFADVVLPPTSPLERSNYDIVFNAVSVRNFAKYSPRVLEPPDDSREQWQILAELAGRVNGADGDQVEEMIQAGIQGATGVDSPEPGPGPERLLDAMLRGGPYEGLSLETLRESPHGIDLGPLQEGRLPHILATESGAIELAPPALVEDVDRLRDRLPERAAGNGLVLVGRRNVRSNNSWMHNVPSLAKGKDRCTLLVHPDDAGRLGLADGGRARVRSRVAEVEAPVHVSDEMMPGVVSLPHGHGHDAPGARLSVAREKAGVNSNRLTDEEGIDLLSGNAILNGIPVDVTPA